MKFFSHLLFDLDGTLTDSKAGIANGVMYALAQFGIRVEDPGVLYSFIGPPLLESFQSVYGFSLERAREATAYYRAYYSEKGLFENAVYSGIPEQLEALRAAGRTLVLATSKPEVYARRILEHFGLDGLFSVIAGAALDESRGSKAAVVRYALERCGLPDPARVLMVGDRKHDVIGAAENGLDCLGVLYGYGSREELEQAGAKYIVETVSGLAPAILAPEAGTAV
ncbi:MAG: HAD family hydrolase [Oscillospiraceae bacterium]|nr:HAD family hydrolase [Oscillospiraceae bacterium]